MCSLQPAHCNVHELYGRTQKAGLEAEVIHQGSPQRGLAGEYSTVDIAAEDLVPEPELYCHLSMWCLHC